MSWENLSRAESRVRRGGHAQGKTRGSDRSNARQRGVDGEVIPAGVTEGWREGVTGSTPRGVDQTGKALQRALQKDA